MKKIRFTNSEDAKVTYWRRDNGAIKLCCDGYTFSRRGWDELTTELFPPLYSDADLIGWLS